MSPLPSNNGKDWDFLWTIHAVACGYTLALAGPFLSTLYDPSPAWLLAVLLLAGAEGLLAACLTGAMAEPMEPTPRRGRPPLRLRVSWRLLGLCTWSGRYSTAALAVATLFLHRQSGLALLALLPGAALLVTLSFMGRREGGLAEVLHLLAIAVAGAGVLVATAAQGPFQAWHGVAALAALVALQGQRIRQVCALRWSALLPGVPPPPALDLSRYELCVARKSPEAHAPLPAGVAARLVDTGSFRVDAARMLDKLRHHQLTDPLDFVCAWLRCAAASCAEEMARTGSWNALGLRFGGRPFSAAELSQPYQILVDGDGADARRGRHFAYGLLALYRLSPARVCVTSRGPGGVATMNAGRGEAPDPAAAPEGTVVRVEWPSWAAFWRPFLAARRARQKYGLGSAGLTVDGARVPDRPQNPLWKTRSKKGWRTVYTPRLSGAKVRLYVLGTLIEELAPPGLRLEAWLANDGLELDISQSSVVRGRRLEEGLRLLPAAGDF
ncbi:MAG: hypothetical protein HYV15_00520 [Elusimicrobia bacterium]|nr:hypothetical protein [Elusimicrobiota bacterium]